MYEPLMRTFTTPHGNPIVMSYRDETNDWNTLTSCLTEDEYGLPSDLTGVAVDVGGHIGSVGIALALDNPEVRVIIVEPLPPNVALIRQNIDQNGVGARVHLLHGAAGRAGETVEVAYGYSQTEVGRHHAFIGNLSMIGDEPPGETIAFPATDLATLVALAGGAIAWMKIDTEGAEYDFLDSPAVKHVEGIVGEWHDGRQKDLVDLLQPTHYVELTGSVDNRVGGFRAAKVHDPDLL